MRHNCRSTHLGRRTGHRMSMLNNLATSLFTHKRITTTHARAKEVQKIAEHLITLAKKGDLAAKRQVFRYIHNRDVAADLFGVIAPQYNESANQAERKSGFTRIIKIGHRVGDAASMVLLELV
ncbi:MAG: 50S ribosomal protein L17 [Firmicutes bacterium]|nr:50S ribosomal protein L17 [Bacillota bacterium]